MSAVAAVSCGEAHCNISRCHLSMCVGTGWVTEALSPTPDASAKERMRVMGKDMTMYLACTRVFWLLMKVLIIFVQRRQLGAED